MKAARKLVGDPIIRDLLPKLKPNELLKLEEGILRDGCLDPIKVWEGEDVIVDGYNRYAICTKHKVPYKIEELEFADKADVLEWLFAFQQARRNWTPEEEELALGRLVAERKKRAKGKAKKDAEPISGDDDAAQAMDDEEEDTPEVAKAQQEAVAEVAAEKGVTVGKAVEASEYTKQMDAIEAAGAVNLRNRLVSRGIKSDKNSLKFLAGLEPDEIKKVELAATSCITLTQALAEAGFMKKSKKDKLRAPGSKPNLGAAFGVCEDALKKCIKAIESTESACGGPNNLSKPTKAAILEAGTHLGKWKQAYRNSNKNK